ncbi:MAG: thioredoxin [Spirochaetes bacterium]|nr:MAG: thioredoxin [Spirochaetota bacterium]
MSIIDEKLREGKPLIVDVGSDNCVPCKMIQPVLKEIEEDYKDSLNVLILNVNENLEIVKELGVMSIPTQFFYDKDGQMIGQHVGFLPKESFQQIIKEQFSL